MNLIKNNWTNKDYQEFITCLKSQEDTKYKNFHKSLIKENINLIGIRTPILKKISTEIYHGNYKEFLNQIKFKYYEETIIYGFIICKIKDIKEVFNYLNIYINHINCWAECDLFVSNLKIVNKNKETFIKYIDENITSTNPWQVRLCYVLLLSYYIDKEHINRIFKYCNNNNIDNYYVKMAISWTISLCYIKYKNITINYLQKENTLDTWTYNKTIQKIIESTRISQEEKEYLKTLKSKH